MNSSQTTSRLGAVLATVGVIAVLAASAQAATSRPAEMSEPAYRALMIRSEALNTLHGNAITRLSPQEFTGLYQAGADRMAPQEFAALVARSEALNRQSRLDRTTQPTKVVEQPTGSGNGFDWGDFGIGAAAMLGFLVLGGALLAGTYFGRRTGARPVT
jgi:hypothetical protein